VDVFQNLHQPRFFSSKEFDAVSLLLSQKLIQRKGGPAGVAKIPAHFQIDRVLGTLAILTNYCENAFETFPCKELMTLLRHWQNWRKHRNDGKSMWKQSSISRDWSASYRGLTIRIKVDPETDNPIEFSLQVADGWGTPAKPWHRRWQIKFGAVNAYAAFHNRR
jgi:hypothetical protein